MRTKQNWRAQRKWEFDRWDNIRRTGGPGHAQPGRGGAYMARRLITLGAACFSALSPIKRLTRRSISRSTSASTSTSARVTLVRLCAGVKEVGEQASRSSSGESANSFNSLSASLSVSLSEFLHIRHPVESSNRKWNKTIEDERRRTKMPRSESLVASKQENIQKSESDLWN